MSKDEVIQTAKAAAEVVLEFVKWYEKREQGLAYMKGEEPAAPRVVQRQEGKPETSAQELKQTKKPAKQTPQRAVKEYRCGESAHTQRDPLSKFCVRKEPLLKKCEISSEMAGLMKEHGWTGPFDCAGLGDFIKTKLPTMSTCAIAQLLFEDERKTGRISSKKSAATCLCSSIAGRRFFSVREMDRFVQTLRELLPPVDDKPSSSGTPSLVWGKADDDSIRDGQNNVVAKDEDEFTPEKAEALEKAALGETCETGENGEPVNTEEPSNTKLQPDLKQGPGRGNWIRNAFKSLTAGL